MAVWLVWALCYAVSIPVCMLALECLVGTFGDAMRSSRAPSPPFIVLMPAHDEAAGIASAIAAVHEQLRPGDELVVVADNCTDNTAEIARALGATVIERNDPARRGKGYALEFGRAFIDATPERAEARIVLIVDADCHPEPGALQRLAATAAARNCTVQGAYLMDCPQDASPVVRVSCFAFLVKNLVRQRALDRLAGAALLQGSGMAFPRAVFGRVRWATSSLVEDVEMGLDLLLRGHAIAFDAAALFHSSASSTSGTESQRRRWEHGMLLTMRRYVPKLLAAGVLKLRGRLLVAALDLTVPPTVLLAMLAFAVTAVALVFGRFGFPVLLLLGADLALAGGIGLAWWKHGQRLLPPAQIGQIAGYILWKLPILAQFVTRRESRWIRTERNS